MGQGSPTQGNPVRTDTARQGSPGRDKGGNLFFASMLARDRGIHLPMVMGGIAQARGDMGQRYGNLGVVGVGYAFAIKGKITIGTQMSFTFGNSVKDDPVSSLRTGDGFVLGNDGGNAELNISQTGFVGPSLLVGRLVPLKIRSGKYFRFEHVLWPQIGPCLLFHRTRIEDASNTVPLLRSGQRKNFDRLTGGVGGLLAVQYLLLAPTGRYGIFLEPGVIVAQTHGLRSYDYNLKRANSRNYLDALPMLRLGLVLTFFDLDDEEVFYY